jgi:C_GCAxxG_C_C family probable redox protein
MKTEGDVIPRIAFGFAGGFGNTGAVCGAVSGGVMGISLKLGPAATMEEGLHILAVVQEFRRRFEAEMKTINCRDLTGADLTTQEGIARFMNSDTPRSVCFPAVGTAYRLAVNLLKESS